MPSPETSASRPALRVGRLLLLLATCALLTRDARTPPAPRDASAPDTAFSAVRAMRHLGVIAARPHPIGSPDAARVRAYLLATLDSLGLAAEVQEVTAVGTRYQALGLVRNVVGRLPGTAPGGPAVLLMSHYDGHPAGPAASDAGSGVATILEVIRALRAGPRPRHDVIVLFTDGEEVGLLGAAAFVREHRWKDDVAVTFNFEARGTGGRALMFETGPGNLDLVQLLRRAPDVSASSLSVTVYRTLNNDTDLSELARLERPALNFAFTDGVERYHTSEDDTLHIDPGSVQHEGAQALALVRAVDNGPLPRPVTADAVFSDVAPFGVLYYGERLAVPLAVVLALLFVGATVLLSRRDARWRRDTLVGVVLTLVSLAAGTATAAGAGAIAVAVHRSVGGDPAFAPAYAFAVISLALAAALGCWSTARRWCGARGLHHGVLLVWTALAVTASVQLPGASYLLAWPLALALPASMLADAGRLVRISAEVAAAYVALAVLVPIIAVAGPVTLGVTGTGGMATGLLVALLCGVLAPTLEGLLPARTHRLAAAAVVVGAAAMAIGAATVRYTAAHPARSMLIYAADADSGAAWLTAPASMARPGSWAAGVLGASSRDTTGAAAIVPPRLAASLPFGGRAVARVVPRVPVEGPRAVVVQDSVTATERLLMLRVVAPRGAQEISIRLPDALVHSAAVDSRDIDTTRFRRPQRRWSFTYSAPPDTGFVLALTLAPTAAATVELASMTTGLPAIPGVAVPARPPGTVATQSGDATVVRRDFVF